MRKKSLWGTVSFLTAAHATIVESFQPPSTHSKVAAAWYAGQHAGAGFPLSDVPWSKYTHLTYSFADTTFDTNVVNLNGSDPAILPKFVAKAHEHGVKALLSVGGWGGSRGFSINVGSAKNRTTFVKTVTKLATQYNLDGIDFDWEFPANQGIGCNTVNPNDTAHFLAFLQELRRDPVGSRLILTAAVARVPFIGPNGDPLTDVSGFSEVLDWITIMSYSIWGPWNPTVGPNAPLNDTCASPENQLGSAVSALRTWGKAGIPVCKIVLGVAAYGHSYQVPKANVFQNGITETLAAYPTFNVSAYPVSDSWDDGEGIDECGNAQDAGWDIDFWGMIELGYLNPDGTPAQNISYRYDACSQTPYVYNSTSEFMVSFDNAQSFFAKGDFIKEFGLRGFAMSEAGSDSNNILLDSVRNGTGFFC